MYKLYEGWCDGHTNSSSGRSANHMTEAEHCPYAGMWKSGWGMNVNLKTSIP